MIIDAHTHFFPDWLAPRTMDSLARATALPPVTDGTIAGSLTCMDENGVDVAAVLHIATKDKNQPSVNEFALNAQTRNARFLCFGSVHPYAPDAVEWLYEIKRMGLHGIKLHPYYQNFELDDPRTTRVYDAIAELRLPLVFHAGYDPCCPNEQHASPRKIAEIAKAHEKLTVIAAHMGGLNSCEEALSYIVGTDVYIDTAASAGKAYRNEKLHREILMNHRSDRILFGSDMPWSMPRVELAYLRELGVAGELYEKVTHKNAEALFGL